MKSNVDVDAKTSELGGFSGFLESLLRRFRIGSYLIALVPLYIMAIMAMSLSAVPGVYLFNYIAHETSAWITFFHYLAMAAGLITGYFAYGMTLIFIIPLFNILMPFRLRPFRGGYYSLETVPWYFHNAFTYVVRYTFLEFVTPTPVSQLFYKMMGMKIGKGAHLNTTNISDPALIEIEDKVTIGGSVHIIGHYASKGYLVVAPVKICKGATIGLKATIMGDVEIGEGATIAPHEVILPKTRIAPGRKPFDTVEKNSIRRKDLPSQDFL